jgi:tetratricopeptide (TPR) repeat protein
MEKIFFRSPILFFVMLFFAVACHRSKSNLKHYNSSEISKGRELEQAAMKFQTQGQVDSAFSYFVEARKHYEKAADSAWTVYALLNIGAIQYQYNDFSEMQTTMVEALKYLDKKSERSYKPIIYNNLGIAYCQLEDYPRAIENYQRTLSLSNSPVHKLTAANNIGYVYISSGEYEKAYEVFRGIYASPHVSDSLSLKARVTDNFGYSAYKLGKPEGVKLIAEGLAIRENIGDDFGQITSYLHLGEALVSYDKEKAIMAVLNAERLAAKTSSPDDRLLALNFLVKYSDPATAKAYSLQYFRISDSLQTARRKARNHFAEVKYNYKLEREEKLRLQANKARLELRESELENARLLWLIAAICVAFTASAIIYKIVQRNRRTRWKASYDAEVRISNRLHDELANDLHQTIVFTETNDLSKSDNKNTLLDNLDLIYRRARGISRENASVGSNDFSKKLKDLISSYGSPGQNVLAKGIGDIDWERLSDQQKVAVHRSVQELLVNMKKHSRSTLAFLQFNENAKKLKICY